MAIALVSGQLFTGFSAGAQSSFSYVLPNNPTLGNLAVADVISGPGVTYSVTDANGNAYTSTPIGQLISSAGSGVTMQRFYLPNTPANASKTINITKTSGTNQTIFGYATEWSGVSVSSTPIGAEASRTSTAASSVINDPTITTTVDQSLSLAEVYSVSNTLLTIGSPWTQLNINSNVMGLGSLIQSTGPTALAGTQAGVGGSPWVALITEFLPTGSTATTILMPSQTDFGMRRTTTVVSY